MTTVIRWLIDTRPLFPSATQTSDLPHAAARAMALLSASEAASVLKYHFLRDAKLALLSALLKRLVISRTLGIPWCAATSSRDARTKPVFVLPTEEGEGGGGCTQQPLIFNVSHQAGVVVLLAVYGAPAGCAVGVDIVCPGERHGRDTATVREDGWAHYVGMHEEVFAAGEAARLRGMGGGLGERLEAFYALWCLREAYVKMTGEALLAPWLGELEMRGWAAPGRETQEQEDEDEDGLEIWFGGERVRDVRVRLERVMGGEYMVATAVRGGGVAEGEFEVLEWEEVLRSAEELREGVGE